MRFCGEALEKGRQAHQNKDLKFSRNRVARPKRDTKATISSYRIHENIQSFLREPFLLIVLLHPRFVSSTTHQNMSSEFFEWLVSNVDETQRSEHPPCIEKLGKKQRWCRLCNTGVFTSSQSRIHMDGRRHRERRNDLVDLKSYNCRRKECASLIEVAGGLQGICYVPWKNHVKSLLFDYVVLKIPTVSFDRIVQLVGRYEYREVLSLLELAMWKARIDGETPRRETDPSKLGEDDGTLSAAFRRSCLEEARIHAIIPRVIAFLTKPSK